MMAKDTTVSDQFSLRSSNAEIAREMRNRETLALLKTFAMAVLSSAGTEHMSKRYKGEV